MTAAETIAEKLLAEVITVGMLRQTMDAENVDMRTAANMWKANLTRYATVHIEDVEHWLKRVDASRWADDPAKEALKTAKTGGYMEGYLDGFADALRIRLEQTQYEEGRGRHGEM